MRFAATHSHVLGECAQRVEAASGADDAMLVPWHPGWREANVLTSVRAARAGA